MNRCIGKNIDYLHRRMTLGAPRIPTITAPGRHHEIFWNKKPSPLGSSGPTTGERARSLDFRIRRPPVRGAESSALRAQHHRMGRGRHGPGSIFPASA